MRAFVLTIHYHIVMYHISVVPKSDVTLFSAVCASSFSGSRSIFFTPVGKARKIKTQTDVRCSETKKSNVPDKTARATILFVHYCKYSNETDERWHREKKTPRN